MNFGTYLPGGKLLGSNLMIQNTTNCEQIIELSIDSTSFRYKIDDLNQMFPQIQNNRSSNSKSIDNDGDVLPFNIH